ncbi:hypothetical protein N8Z47_01470 [Salibacteraceae bacterium]|nr:hypothetical protein [Salibacteraceae bacterium]
MQIGESKSTTYELDQGILVSIVKPNRIFTKEDVIENLNIRKNLDVQFPIPFLMDIRNLPDIKIDAIIAMGNPPDKENYSAVALVVNSSLHEFVGRESKRFKRHDVPYRIFSSVEKAKTWLATFL